MASEKIIKYCILRASICYTASRRRLSGIAGGRPALAATRLGLSQQQWRQSAVPLPASLAVNHRRLQDLEVGGFASCAIDA